MSRSRSPNYPQIGLKEALQRVASVYKRDYQAPLTRDLAAERLGYSGLNGKSLAVLAALGKFGLLEGRGEETRVTDLAVRILAFSPGSPERRAALAEAAGRPELFAELDQRFARGQASDGAIRSWLMTRGFIPPAAEAAVRAYRETKQLLEAEGEAGTPAPLAQLAAAEAEPAGTAAKTPVKAEAATRRAVFGLAEGEVVITAPVFLSAESVNDLQDYLDVFMKRARREAGLPS
ncbi:MAG: hypothetical protein HIU92_14550 [Proteobacteria bacterium]|nr:hypothetical protein [Pseudomonadota bacterium]